MLHSHDSERTTSGLGSSSVDLLARGPLSSAPVVSTPADAPQYWQGAIYDDFDGTRWTLTASPHPLSETAVWLASTALKSPETKGIWLAGSYQTTRTGTLGTTPTITAQSSDP